MQPPTHLDSAHQPRTLEPAAEPASEPATKPSSASLTSNAPASSAEIDQLLTALFGEPRHELKSLLSAPRYVRLINPTPRFVNAVFYLPAPRVWPDALMDDWVLENINTRATRIAVPSLVILLAIERDTGTLYAHVFDLSVAALRTLRGLAAIGTRLPPLPGSLESLSSPSSLISLSGEAAEQAWALLDVSGHRHYASFDHRHEYDDPELRMRVAPSRVPLLLPGVAIGIGDDDYDGGEAVDAAFTALCGRPVASLLSPWLPIGLMADRASELTLASLHASSWAEESANWVLARHAEIRSTVGHHWRVSAALASLQNAQCAEPMTALTEGKPSEPMPAPAVSVARVWIALKVLSAAHPASGTLPAFNWLNAPGNDAEQALRIDTALAAPAGALESWLNLIESEGAHRAAVDFLRTMRGDSDSDSVTGDLE